MWKKLKLWLFPTEVEGFNYNAIDRDNDGLVQEGTPFERKVTVVKKTAKKPAAKKKTPAKKSPAKKTVKKSTPKKKK
jgi:topoisomerase IA-like protein